MEGRDTGNATTRPVCAWFLTGKQGTHLHPSLWCAEIFTNAEQPYKGFSNQKVWVEVLASYRLPQPPLCPDRMYQLMRACWAVRIDCV